jgi:hypothetical protein
MGTDPSGILPRWQAQRAWQLPPSSDEPTFESHGLPTSLRLVAQLPCRQVNVSSSHALPPCVGRVPLGLSFTCSLDAPFSGCNAPRFFPSFGVVAKHDAYHNRRPAER